MTVINRYRGDTKPVTGVVSLAGVALDVTGCTFILTVDPAKAPADATNNLFSLTGTIVNAATGSIKFPMTATQSNQTPGTYYYDIQLVDAVGDKHTIALDRFGFLQDITK